MYGLVMRKFVVLLVLLVSCGGSGTKDERVVVDRFCLPGSDGTWWEHVKFADGEINPTGAQC